MWMEHMIAHLFLGLKNYHQVLCVFTWVRTFGPPYFLISNKNCIKIKHPKYTIGVLREKYNQTHYNAQTCLFFIFYFFFEENEKQHSNLTKYEGKKALISRIDFSHPLKLIAFRSLQRCHMMQCGTSFQNAMFLCLPK